MDEVLKIIAEELTSKKKRLNFKHDSIFSAINMAPNEETSSSIANRIAELIKNDLTVIKTELMPIVKEYKANVIDKMNSNVPTNNINKFKVISYELPDIVSVLKDKNIIVDANNGVELPITTISLDVPDDIKSYLKFDSGLANEELQVILAEYTDHQVADIWTMYLGNISESNINITSLNNIKFSNLNDVIILLAMVVNLKTNIPKGVRLSEGKYMQVIDLLQQKISGGINSLVNNYDLFEKFDRVILDSTDTELIVHTPMYNKFTENNSVEVLLGLLISGEADKKITIEQLTINSEKYIAKWEHFVKMEQFKSISTEPLRYKTAYSIALTQLLDNIPESVSDMITIDKAHVDEALEYLFKDMHPDHLGVVDNVTKDVMGLIVFANSNLYKYLEFMYTYYRKNKELTTEELYTLASVDMIFDYLIQQIDIVDV